LLPIDTELLWCARCLDRAEAWAPSGLKPECIPLAEQGGHPPAKIFQLANSCLTFTPVSVSYVELSSYTGDSVLSESAIRTRGGESVRIRILWCIIVLASSGAASQSLTPLLSFDTFHSLGFTSTPGYGALLAVPIAGAFSCDLTAVFSTPNIIFDNIGGTTSAAVRVTRLQAAVAIRVAGDDHSIGVALVGGGGTILSHVPPMTISLGALGSHAIPDRSSGNGFLLGGLRFEAAIAPQLGFVVTPAVRFVSTEGRFHRDVSVAGGISVHFFR
jgi:hypothetical protein